MLVADLDKLLESRKSEFGAEVISKANHVRACKAASRAFTSSMAASMKDCSRKFFPTRNRTLIYANEYEQIRRALKKDIAHHSTNEKFDATAELMKPPARKSKKHIATTTFTRSTKTRRLRGPACISDTKQGELAFLYVKSSHENQACRKLVQFVEKQARKLGWTN